MGKWIKRILGTIALVAVLLVLAVIALPLIIDPNAFKGPIQNAARDPVLAQDFNAYERGIEAQLAGPLERLGADRPVEAARTVIGLMRGFELERLTRPNTSVEDLRRRIEVVVSALTGAGPAARA